VEKVVVEGGGGGSGGGGGGSGGGASCGEIILGPSASVLLRHLALAYSALLKPGDEVVVCEWSHEAHVAPWLEAARVSGASVKWWRLEHAPFEKEHAPYEKEHVSYDKELAPLEVEHAPNEKDRVAAKLTTMTTTTTTAAAATTTATATPPLSPARALASHVIGPKTAVVAFTHVSNILGSVVDVAKATEAVSMWWWLLYHTGKKKW
jgi:selenocysteine lyase/cysteine desulfurase